MKKLFFCLAALLCAVGMSVPAMADALVPHASPGSIALTLLLGVACIAAAVVIVILRKRKK